MWRDEVALDLGEIQPNVPELERWERIRKGDISACVEWAEEWELAWEDADSKEETIDLLLVMAEGHGWRHGIGGPCLYIDLPTGQVSFHVWDRYPDMEDYEGEWDGAQGSKPERLEALIRWAKAVDNKSWERFNVPRKGGGLCE